MTIFVQEEDPGVPRPWGDEWRIPSSGECYCIHPDLHTWVYRGNANIEGMGCVQASGANFYGPILRADSLATPFALSSTTGRINTTDAYLDGIKIALSSDITEVTSEIYTHLQNKVKDSMMASVSKGADSICMVMGTLPFGDDGIRTSIGDFTTRHIPKPKFEDGTEPSDDLTFWFYWQDSVYAQSALTIFRSETFIHCDMYSSRDVNASCVSEYVAFGYFPNINYYVTYNGVDLNYVCFGIR